MYDQIKIKTLKSKLKNYYKKYMKLTEDYDCGVNLASYITPEIQVLRKKMNNVLDELADLDSSCPRKRF